MTALAHPALEDNAGRHVDALVAKLLASNAITDVSIERARRAAASQNERIDKVLLKLGLIEERTLARSWTELLGLPSVDLSNFPAQPVIPDLLSAQFVRNSGALPISLEDGLLRLAILDPLDFFAPAAIAARTGHRVQIEIVTATDFDTAFRQIYDLAPEHSSESIDLASGDIVRLRDLATDAPAILLANSFIERAVELKASDIHVTIGRKGPRLRYRMDGVLVDRDPHPAPLHDAIVSRLKVLADLDIAERRLPQDGRIRVTVSGREIDLRVATMPHLEGEGVVLRLLDRAAVKPDLHSLGFQPDIEESINRLLAEPHGIFLVTGPTGSGKTTTLYAALRRLVQPERNVLTVEDPVEYQLDGVAQIQIQRKIGLDFPTVLRAVLRQDPDIIMIGEIRDSETATIANQAALTGHFVLATLHTNSAAASLPRLVDMGLEPYLLSSTVRGILSQRLVRTLCTHCARAPKDFGAVEGLLHRLGPAMTKYPLENVREAVGCPSCNHTGYMGRNAIGELLVVDDAIRGALLEQADASQIESIALRRGLTSLFQAGIVKVLSGETSLAELFRVAGQKPIQ